MIELFIKNSGLIGLVFATAGSLILAFSVEKHPDAYYENGKPLTLLHVIKFRIGIILILIGFLIQIANILFN